jgi:hypothetical protein
MIAITTTLPARQLSHHQRIRYSAAGNWSVKNRATPRQVGTREASMEIRDRPSSDDR